MPSSDSEGFESADEGIINFNKKERKKRLSSSNYSENLTDEEVEKGTKSTLHKSLEHVKEKDIPKSSADSRQESKTGTNTIQENTGWDDFDDWGDTNVIEQKEDISRPKNEEILEPKVAPIESEIQTVADRLAASSTKTQGWGWGWGVDSLLSSATAGITTITSQVSQGISTVLETGIGAPDPEELARKSVKDMNKPMETVRDDGEVNNPKPSADANENAFQFGSLLSGVTKFVETTGTKVISGGLGTLETIGKKTMEVLQDGDPGLAKKRAMLGLDSGDKPVLSQLLREAKAKADEEDSVKEAKLEAKEVHYETLFDDYEGLIHLEALEMLSKQTSMRIDDLLRTISPEKRQDVRETLQQVSELCEMPEDEDDEDEPEDKGSPMHEVFHDKLQKATKDMGLKMQFQALVKQYQGIVDWLNCGSELTDKVIYKRAVSGLAETTALAMELYHKTAELLLVKSRRSTADEADALTQLTVVLTKHVSDLASLFTEKLNGFPSPTPPEDPERINKYITNVFLEAGNSSKYIENAFHLILPIVQIGAV